MVVDRPFLFFIASQKSEHVCPITDKKETMTLLSVLNFFIENSIQHTHTHTYTNELVVCCVKNETNICIKSITPEITTKMRWRNNYNTPSVFCVCCAWKVLARCRRGFVVCQIQFYFYFCVVCGANRCSDVGWLVDTFTYPRLFVRVFLEYVLMVIGSRGVFWWLGDDFA